MNFLPIALIKIATINLMFPQLITLQEHEIKTIEPFFGLFAQHGITLDRFSQDQLIIQSTPVHVKNAPLMI